MKNITLLLFITINSFAQEKTVIYPEARMDTITDNYFGTKVADPYRWLENDSTPQTIKWLEEEKDLSDNYLHKLLTKYTPEFQLLLNSYMDFGTLYKSGKYYFDWRRSDHLGPSCLYIKKKIDGAGEILIDPDDYKEVKHGRVELESFNVSEDNKYIAFEIARNGGDWREIYVKTLFPFHKCNDYLEGIKFSSIEWSGNGFFYIRYPQKGEPLKSKNLNASVWYHKLGEDQKNDQKIFENKEYPEADISIDKLPIGNYLIIYNKNEINGEFIDKQVLAIDLKNKAPFTKIDTILSVRTNDNFNVIDVYKEKFLISSTLNAPNGKLLLCDRYIKNKIKVFIPEYPEILHSAHVIGNKIQCTYLKDVEYMAITFDTTGTALKQISFPAGCSVNGFDYDGNDSMTIFWHKSFLYPPITYQYNVNDFSFEIVDKTKVAYDFNNFEITKVFFTSKDGTKIPMFLAAKKGLKKNGATPTLLYGYGGYGETMTPFYDNGFISFMQNGGIVALPCLRGGGEYGQEWHMSGSRFNKQNVFDDFIGAAEYLFKENYTNRDKLALMGGSNGGLLIAAVINQRPDLCKVAIAEKGVYDMLRFQNYTIGRAWMEEYGSSNDPAEFKNLIQYSPLHNIKEAAYPAILIITSDHDDRVVPLHSYKYAAALQKMNKGNNPILLYVQKNLGHQEENQHTKSSIYSFIYDELKIPVKNLHTLEY